MKLKRGLLSITVDYLVAALLFITIPPYFVWDVPGYFGTLVTFAIVFISYIECNGFSKKNIGFALFIFVVFLWFSYRDGRNILGIASVFLLCSILLFSTDYISRVFDDFIRIYALLMIPSLIVFILVIFVDVSFLPSKIIEPLNDLKSYNYIQYPLLVVPNSVKYGVFRFSAYFDEPGVVGTISGALLVARGIKFDKWETYPILLSGILSLSLAFYIMLFIYIMLFESFKVKIISIIIGTALFIYFENNDIVTQLLFDRLELEDNKLAGINRTTSEMDFFMTNFVNSDDFLLGFGNNYSQNSVNIGGASYKDLIVNYGIVGFTSLILVTLIIAVKRLGFSVELLQYVCICIGVLYQRPFIFMTIYFYLLYVPPIYLERKQNERRYFRE